jgi:hypothetical protein
MALYKCVKGVNIAIVLALLARQSIVKERRLYLVFYLSVSTGGNTKLI